MNSGGSFAGTGGSMGGPTPVGGPGSTFTSTQGGTYGSTRQPAAGGGYNLGTGSPGSLGAGPGSPNLGTTSPVGTGSVGGVSSPGAGLAPTGTSTSTSGRIPDPFPGSGGSQRVNNSPAAGFAPPPAMPGQPATTQYQTQGMPVPASPPQLATPPSLGGIQQ
ncbi:MAG: hypothetical protein IT429_24795 [Gemmataceae bacterium]|nr:hypothetical protein [Gemmataceae bacterium]